MLHILFLIMIILLISSKVNIYKLKLVNVCIFDTHKNTHSQITLVNREG